MVIFVIYCSSVCILYQMLVDSELPRPCTEDRAAVSSVQEAEVEPQVVGHQGCLGPVVRGNP